MEAKLEAKAGRRYEVALRRDGRWIIDCLAPSEAEALARADALYADEAIEAVRVHRGRFGRDGLAYESQILERVREARRGEAPVRIGARPADEAWCETLDDFYGPASRRAIARLLRNFLDRYAITPTELLHHHRYIRLLDRQEALGPQALQRMAALQASQHGGDARARLDLLTGFADAATARARDALASRGAPRLGAGGLGALVADIAAATQSHADRAFHLRFAISRAFEELGDPAEKLALVLRWAEAKTDALLPLFDELVAGLLGAASLIQQLLGPQAHLAGALGTLADLAQGRAAERAPALLAQLAQLMADARMVETEGVLAERITRELASDKPLSHEDRQGERRHLETLMEKLAARDGLLLGGSAMVEALARRSRRLEIVGGIEALRFQSDDPGKRIDELLVLAAGVRSEIQERALGTYLAAELERWKPAPGAAAALRPKLAALNLGEAAKKALLARLPAPAAA